MLRTEDAIELYCAAEFASYGVAHLLDPWKLLVIRDRCLGSGERDVAELALSLADAAAGCG